MLSELEQIKQIFDNFGMPLSMEWLESCIEWCKNDNLPPNYTLRNLQNMIYEQWLILDLRDVEISSLPRNLASEKKYSLTGVYYLQLMQVTDISKPKLWQLQRIRNNVARNTESENDFGKRVLQLTLTDGVQEIEAMEFKPIPCLSINLTPGSKFKIIGPVMVRNGRLMLESDNVKSLGGSVDDLIVKFAAENVLARALGLQENPKPHTIDEKVLEVNTQANTSTQSNTTAYNQNHMAMSTQNRAQNNQNQPRNNHMTQQNLSINTQNVSAPNTASTNRQTIMNQKIPPEFEVDDELLRELEEDFEENSVRNFKESLSNTQGFTQSTNIARTSSTSTGNNQKTNKTASTTSNRLCTSPDLFDEMEFDDELLNKHFDQIDKEYNTNKKTIVAAVSGTGFSNNTTKQLDSVVSIKKEKRFQDVVISSSSQTKNPDGDDEVIVLDDSFDDIDIDSHLDHIDEEMADIHCSTQKIRDIKEKIKSPALKKMTSTPKLSMAKPQASKKLMQGKLAFGTSSASTNVPGTSKGGLHFDSDDDDFENPFSIFKSGQKRPPNFVPLDIPGISKKVSSASSKETDFKNPFERDRASVPKSTPLEVPNTSKNSPTVSKENDLKTPPKINVMPIEKLKKLLPNISKGKFKIKGKFQTVAEKLKTTETSFYLVITVADETGDVTVEVHPDIVANFAQTTPEKLAELRGLALKKDQVAREKIFETLRNLHARCMALDNVLELQITRGERYPVVINLVDVEES